jgi:hypothetical protein
LAGSRASARLAAAQQKKSKKQLVEELVASGRLTKLTRRETIVGGHYLSPDDEEYSQSIVYINPVTRRVIKQIMEPDEKKFYGEVYRYFLASEAGMAPRFIGFYWAEDEPEIVSELHGKSLRMLMQDQRTADNKVAARVRAYIRTRLAAHPEFVVGDVKDSNILVLGGTLVGKSIEELKPVFADWGAGGEDDE